MSILSLINKPLIPTVLFISLSQSAYADDGPPGTDIYVADIGQTSSGSYQLGTPEQITRRHGYDNQPFFLPKGKGLLYTGILQQQDGVYQADNFAYDFATKQHTNLTNSQLSEYSPTLMPFKINNQAAFSAIVVEDDGKQFLWSLPYHSKHQAGRLIEAEPVGYHVWGSKRDLAMFVLGEPHTLQYQATIDGTAKVVAQDIGRSLRYVAKRDSFSFSQLKLEGKDTWWLSEYQPKGDKVTALVPLPEGSDYYTWLDADTAVTAVNGVLHTWHYQRSKDGKSATVADWLKWADVSAVCTTKITRLAVDDKQRKLAFVCDE